MNKLLTMDDLDSELTTNELAEALTEMTSCEAPASDGIPADYFVSTTPT